MTMTRKTKQNKNRLTPKKISSWFKVCCDFGVLVGLLTFRDEAQAWAKQKIEEEEMEDDDDDDDDED